jgi:hypothetical protein
LFKKEILHRIKEERNNLHKIKRRQTDWIGHILRTNCLLILVIDGKIEGMRRGGRRRQQLVGNFKKKRRH